MKKLRINIIAICALMVLLTACKKNNAIPSLPVGSVSFDQLAGKDTIQMPLSILSNTAIVLQMDAMLNGSTSGTDHNITFAVDTTKMAAYRAKYGTALLLPATSYLFYKPVSLLSAGSTKSDSAQLNIGQETGLTEYSTYVLPVVIKAVDGNSVDGIATSRVIYYVFKTGKPLFCNKTNWTIASYSSQNGTSNAATAVLDANNTTTYWLSSTTQAMPQNLVINFNQSIVFTGLTYYFPTSLSYPTYGAYPTSIQIESSNDGVSWTNLGTFAGNIASSAQTIPLPTTTARYVRFTVLASVKFVGAYNVVAIAGISMLP